MNRFFTTCGFCLCFLLVYLQEISAQRLELLNEDNFRRCTTESAYNLKTTNNSDLDFYKGFKIDWGDNTEVSEFSNVPPTHKYLIKGHFILKFYGQKNDGSWSEPIPYDVYYDNATPTVELKAGGEGGLCVGEEIAFRVSGLKSNLPITKYHLEFGDQKSKDFTGADYTTDYVDITHKYDQSGCELSTDGGGKIYVTLTLTNACGDEFGPTFGPYSVAEQVKMSFNPPEKECTGNEIYFSAFTGFHPADCMDVELRWDVKDEEGNVEEDINLPYVFTEPGKYKVKAYGIRNMAACSQGEMEKEIRILRRVKAIATPESSVICEGGVVRLKGSASEGDEVTYRWTVMEGGAANVAFAPNATTADPVATFKKYGTYRLMLKVDNGCSVDYAYVDVEVKKNPEISLFKELGAICPRTTVRLSEYITYDWTWPGNPHTPHWSVEPSEGVTFIPDNRDAEFPNIKFTKPGDYTVKVKLDGVGCGDASKLEVSRPLTVYDEEITGEITHSELDVCESVPVIFQNGKQGVHLSTDWSVTDHQGNAVEERFTKHVSADGKQVEFVFNQYGDYRITADLTAECQVKKESFAVVVRKAPEVYYTAFPDVVCPENPFFPGDYIDFRPNGNENVGFTWEVSGGSQPATLEGATTRRPKIIFREWGTYTIKLTITNPTSCVSPSTEITKTLEVSNPQMDLEIVQDRTTVCVGEVVEFENTSVVAIEPTYFWGVSPESYEFLDGYGQTSPAPRIRFLQSGIYNVTAVVNGVCRPETKPYTIIVQQDPEVMLAEIPDRCPGTLVLTDELVRYVWNDSWKSGAESTRRAVWRLVDQPLGAVCTPPESGEWNVLNPELSFQTPGRYTLEVEVKSDAACGGSKRVASREFTVYDPAIRLNIEPQLGGQGEPLPGENTYQVVEGFPVTFENTSTGVGLSYRWTVTPAEQVAVSDAGAKSPVLTFHHFGTYRVRVDVTGTCATAFKEFTFVVKGVPKFDFQPIENLCDNAAEIDLRDYLTCDSAGSTNIFCNWTLTPGTGYTITGGTTSDMFCKILFRTAGTYTLTLKAQAEYGGEQTVSQTVRVLRSAVEAKAELSQTDGCTDDHFQVVATNRSDNDLAEYRWWVTPSGGRDTLAATDKLTVDFREAGDYQIHLRAENICRHVETTYVVHAYAKPQVTVLGATDLGRVCEKGYLFEGAAHVGAIDVKGDPLVSVHWEVSPVGGTFANGTQAADERPDLTFVGGRDYVITGEFRNHCSEATKVEYTLGVDEFKDVVLMPDTNVCALGEPFLLRATPAGGSWSTSPAGYVSSEGEDAYFFHPAQDEDRNVRIIYERGNGTCLSRDSATVTIWKLPAVEAGADRTACENWEVQELQGIEPLDGIWYGSGVREGNHFYPQEALAGEHRLEYRFRDPSTGCVNRDSIRMTVYGLPDPEFSTSPRHCRSTDSLFVPLQSGLGNQYSWDFGDTHTGTSEGPIAHAYATPGFYQVSVMCTSVRGCVATAGPKQIEVMDLPPVALFDVDNDRGCGPLEVAFAADPAHYQGEHLDLQYQWAFGNGQTDDRLQPDPASQTFLPRLSDTTYVVRLKVYNMCGSSEASREIQVYSSPVAKFRMTPPDEGCDPLEVTFINLSSGSGNQYNWTFGDGTTSMETHPAPHVYRSGTKATEYHIKMVATNRCNTSEYLDTVMVKPNSLLVRFIKDKKYICAGTTVCFTNYSTDTSSTILNQYWDFGDGKRSTEWDVCHRYDSTGHLPVTVTISNGCAVAAFSDTVVVYPVPRLTIAPVASDCEDELFHFDLTSDQVLKSVIWEMGDGRQEDGMSVQHVYEEPGNYRTVVEVQLAEIPSCKARDSVDVEVWPKPRVKILPLDTMGCSPLDYRPSVIATGYDYFKWEYGDGTEITSETGHVYRNDTGFILTYPLTVYVENNRGCREEHHGTIKVYNAPKAAWEKEISYGRPEKVRFINLSRDYTECIWYLPDGRVVNSPDDQMMTFEEEDIYPMALAVVNEYGCRDSLYEDYRSYKGGLYFPNTFIPHSSNPKVNHFTGIGMGLKEYRLEIFDLYNNKLWETDALIMGEPAEGWDGCNKDGKPMPQGVYIWRAKAVFFSEDVWTGDNNRSGKAQSTQGTVLLLRE